MRVSSEQLHGKHGAHGNSALRDHMWSLSSWPAQAPGPSQGTRPPTCAGLPHPAPQDTFAPIGLPAQDPGFTATPQLLRGPQGVPRPRHPSTWRQTQQAGPPEVAAGGGTFLL